MECVRRPPKMSRQHITKRLQLISTENMLDDAPNNPLLLYTICAKPYEVCDTPYAGLTQGVNML